MFFPVVCRPPDPGAFICRAACPPPSPRSPSALPALVLPLPSALPCLPHDPPPLSHFPAPPFRRAGSGNGRQGAPCRTRLREAAALPSVGDLGRRDLNGKAIFPFFSQRKKVTRCCYIRIKLFALLILYLKFL